VTLESEDCTEISGAVEADNAVMLGAMVAFAGPQAGVNRARLRSMQLAVEELNALGGVPLEPARPLILVACDESSDAERAAKHLTDTLHVPAIIGPTGSQTSLDVTTRVTIPGKTLTLSPTALAESLAELRDNDLSWLMVPSDAQRGPLLIHEIAETESALRKQRKRDLKLSLVFQNDALGAGSRSALVDLKWNDVPLSTASNLGLQAKLANYDPKMSSHADLVDELKVFAPDLIVLAAGNSVVNDLLAPLEAAWTADARPEYVLIDAAKGPDLLQLVAATPALQKRVRGTGVSPSPESEAVYRSFLVDYESHHPGDTQASSSGVGTSYDAVYALAFAMVASRADSASDIAHGLRALYSQGEEPLAIGPTTTLAAFRALQTGQPVALQGTFSALAWDDRGAIAAGTLEVWCVDGQGDAVTYRASGLTAELPSQALQGENKLCGAAASEPEAPKPDAGMPQMPMQPSDAGAAKPMQPMGMETMTPPKMPDAGVPNDPTAPMRPGTMRPMTPRAIPCGTASCRREQREYCCIEAILGEAGAAQSRFRCAVGPSACVATLSCSSDNECDPGQICCIDAMRRSQCRAASSCGRDLHLACDSPDDCAPGEFCCALGNDANALRPTTCSRQCDSGYPGVACQAEDDCPDPTECRQSWPLPSMGMCFYPERTPQDP
jgi:ABC-type branched-subunit amino acid transport system substrate-binding protein